MSRAFTLIELLVYVLIVAVIIGIVLPTLAPAVGSSRTVECASNLRDAVATLNLLADQQFDERYPVSPPKEDVPICPEWDGRNDPQWHTGDRWGHFKYHATHREWAWTGSTLVAEDIEPWHGGKRNRVYGDGSVVR